VCIPFASKFLIATPHEADDEYEYFIGPHVLKLCQVVKVHSDPDDFTGYAVTLSSTGKMLKAACA
jgi:hypothetical protein